MGFIYADIELINAADLTMARRQIITHGQVKKMPLNILVDTSAYYLCINESIRQQLDLPLAETRKCIGANGEIKEFDIVGPVQVLFKNRKTLCYAMVLEGDNEPLLGAIPLEDMDVLIHPFRDELIEKVNYSVTYN
jgi:clan AA aspartic protease